MHTHTYTHTHTHTHTHTYTHTHTHTYTHTHTNSLILTCANKRITIFNRTKCKRLFGIYCSVDNIFIMVILYLYINFHLKSGASNRSTQMYVWLTDTLQQVAICN